jgi:hypothetical protein
VRLQSRAHSAHTSKIETNDLWNGHHSRDKSYVRQKHAKTTLCSANIFSSIENSIIFLRQRRIFQVLYAQLARRDQSWSPSRLPSTLPIADHVVTSRASVAAPSRDGKSTGVASRFGNTSRRQSSSVGKPTEAAGARKSGERGALIEQHCSDTNRRINDPIFAGARRRSAQAPLRCFLG